MMKVFLFSLALVAGLIAPPGVMAQSSGQKRELPPGAIYRYESANGSTELTNRLPPEAIKRGYEVLDKNGRVIREVAPAMTEQEREQLKREQQRKREAARQKKEDEKLLRLYAGPSDAGRARDRQIDALQVNISYARNNVDQLKDKLAREVSAAARHERQGREVPESIHKAIDHYQAQIDELEREIDEYEREIESVREEFEPIIERLKVITDEDGESVSPEDQRAD